MIEIAGHLLGIDTPEPVRIGSNEFYIAGWFVPASAEPPAGLLTVTANGVRALIECGLRHEPIAQLGAKYCGFVARFTTTADVVNIRVAIGREERRVQAYSAKFKLMREAGLSSYVQWLCAQETRSGPGWKQALRRLTDRGPIFSIICDSSLSRPVLISSCLRSLLHQRYGRFELFVPETAADEAVRDLARNDSRIKIARLSDSKTGTECLNAITAEASGSFLLIITGGDELHASALVELSCATDNADVDIVYSDEDSINARGERSDPIFKPDFDREIVVQENYLGGLLAFRRSALLEAGGFSKEAEPEFRNWDAVLRLSKKRKANVSHIPKILYHRRVGLTANRILPGFDAKAKAKLRFVQSHLAHTSDKGVELLDTSARVRLRYTVPDGQSTAIFLRTSDGPFQEAVLLPEAHRLGAAFYNIEGISVHRGDAACKQAQVAGGVLGHTQPIVSSRIITLSDITEDILLFINGPLESVSHFFLEELSAQAARPDVALVSGLSLDEKGHILHSGLMSSGGGDLVDPFAGTKLSAVSDWLHFRTARQVEAITGHAFAIRRELLARHGGLPAIQVNTPDRLISDVCGSAAAAGLKVLVTPFAIASFACLEPACYMAPHRRLGRRPSVSENLVSFLRMVAVP